MTQRNEGSSVDPYAQDQQGLASALDQLRDTLKHASSAATEVRSRVFHSGAARSDGELPWWYLPLLKVAREYVADYDRCRPQRMVASVAEFREALAIIDGAREAARSPAPEGGRLPRDADIILEALNEYDTFMLDDDYDAQGCLTRVMERMRERYEFVDRSAQPDQADLLRDAAKAIRNYQGALDDLWCNYLEHAVGGPAAWDEYGASASGSGLDTLAKIQKELGDG